MAKIVHLTSVHDPFDTRILFKECQSLRRAGHDVVLVAPHCADEMVDGVRIRAVPLPQNRRSRFLKTTIQVVRAAIAERADLVHLHDPELLPFAPVLRLRGARVVFDMHENGPAALRSKTWIPAKLRAAAARTFRLVERLLLFRVPTILAEESYEASYGWISNRVTVLNLPLASELLAIRGDRYDRPTVGYMGVVSADRGSTVTVDALASLAKEGLEIDFRCIGRIAPETAMFVQESLGETARVYGPLRPHDGWEIMARCHAGLALLRPIPNYLESYPTKMFEYMALGLPVICSNFPLYKEVIEEAECGLCVDPEDLVAVARAIRWIVEHPIEATEMGARGRAAVETRYSWRNEETKLLEFYRLLLNAG